jgi:N-methylhydantoinase B/oxoprolinase/acetone carboxylase alpha subunit
VTIGKPVKVAVTLRVRGSAVTFDFTGSDPQVRGPFNSVPASTMSAVYYAVRAISDASIPNNGGCFCAVAAVLPEGTIVNPRPPAPVSCRTATIKRIANTILGALVGALPGKMPAARAQAADLELLLHEYVPGGGVTITSWKASSTASAASTPASSVSTLGRFSRCTYE